MTIVVAVVVLRLRLGRVLLLRRSRSWSSATVGRRGKAVVRLLLRLLLLLRVLRLLRRSWVRRLLGWNWSVRWLGGRRRRRVRIALAVSRHGRGSRRRARDVLGSSRRSSDVLPTRSGGRRWLRGRLLSPLLRWVVRQGRRASRRRGDGSRRSGRLGRRHLPDPLSVLAGDPLRCGRRRGGGREGWGCRRLRLRRRNVIRRGRRLSLK